MSPLPAASARLPRSSHAATFDRFPMLGGQYAPTDSGNSYGVGPGLVHSWFRIDGSVIFVSAASIIALLRMTASMRSPS